MTVSSVLDAAGRRRSPATHARLPRRATAAQQGACVTRPTRRRSRRSSRSCATPATTATAGALRALIVVLWRAGLRIQEALALSRARPRPAPRLGARAPRQGRPPPRGRHGRLGLGAAAAVARRARRAAGRAAVLRHRRPDPRAAVVERRGAQRAAPARRSRGVRRRFAPHQLRHAHAVELAREGVPLNVIQRQLGHANLGTTSIYLQGIDTEEIIATVHARRAPMMPASAGLQL